MLLQVITVLQAITLRRFDYFHKLNSTLLCLHLPQPLPLINERKLSRAQWLLVVNERKRKKDRKNEREREIAQKLYIKMYGTE
jgi:hypothetical protein